MKRSIIIISGIVIILLLAGVWVYLLFFGSENPSDVFGNLGIAPDNEEITITPSPEPTATSSTQETLALSDAPLQQLTTKPVVGYRFIYRSDEVERVVFAEAGTGHVYEIDLETSTETRISKTTIPGASAAVFSASGTEAVIISDDATEAIVGTINMDEESMELRSIPAKVIGIAAGGDNEALFLEQQTNRSVGRLLNLNTFTERILFTLPFSSAKVSWGRSGSDAHYAFPRPAARLPGYLYRAETAGVGYTGVEGFGLSALAGSQYFLITSQEAGHSQSYFIDKVSGEKTDAPLYLFPEKCTFDAFEADIMYCAATLETPEGELPDDWYKGVSTFSDTLWQIFITTGEGVLLSSLEGESGRAIDVASISMDKEGSALLFTNKLDNSLWYYDLKK